MVSVSDSLPFILPNTCLKHPPWLWYFFASSPSFLPTSFSPPPATLDLCPWSPWIFFVDERLHSKDTDWWGQFCLLSYYWDQEEEGGKTEMEGLKKSMLVKEVRTVLTKCSKTEMTSNFWQWSKFSSLWGCFSWPCPPAPLPSPPDENCRKTCAHAREKGQVRNTGMGLGLTSCSKLLQGLEFVEVTWLTRYLGTSVSFATLGREILSSSKAVVRLQELPYL